MHLILPLIACVTGTLALLIPPPKSVVVGPGGFSSIQKALDSLSLKDTTPQTIFIHKGTYNEQITIHRRNAHLKIIGSTSRTNTYANNEVTITHKARSLDVGGDRESATVLNKASNTAFYNLNIVNTWGIDGGPAVALAAEGDRQAYHNCQIKANQDTLYAISGKQYYGGCFIEGTVDMIFGKAEAFITKSKINVIRDRGVVTASGRNDSNSPAIIVIDQCAVISTAKSTSVYWGRPWQPYAQVVVQSTAGGGIINPEGWSSWQPDNPQTQFVKFFEYQNTPRWTRGVSKYSTEIKAPYTIQAVLGPDYGAWVNA